MFQWTKKSSEFSESVIDILLQWMRRKLLAPLPSIVTKTLLYVGASVVAWPLIEHIVFSAILKTALGIDLGIQPPGADAYLAGVALMVAGAVYSYKVIATNAQRELRIVDAKTSVLSKIWELGDDAVQQATELVGFYVHQPKNVIEIASSAHGAAYDFMDALRKNRPFILSEELYREAKELAEKCSYECRVFNGHLSNIKSKSKSFSLPLALKEAEAAARELEVMREGFCRSLTKYLKTISG